MKKALSLILSLIIISSMIGCGNNATESMQPNSPRPLAMRNELLQELQSEYSDIKLAFESAVKEDEKETLKQQMKENLKAQTEIMNGINGEENFNDLRDKLEKATEAAQLYNDLGDTDKANEILEMMNIICYGNKEGKKTW